MSVSPADDELIVALDFEGEFHRPSVQLARYDLRMEKQQASTVSNVLLKRTRFSFFSILPFPIS